MSSYTNPARVFQTSAAPLCYTEQHIWPLPSEEPDDFVARMQRMVEILKENGELSVHLAIEHYDNGALHAVLRRAVRTSGK